MSDATQDLAGRVCRMLGALGTTPDDVARALHAAGSRGFLRCPSSCPVATYLRRAIKADGGVTGVGVRVTERECQVYSMQSPCLSVAVPRPVGVFVCRFDSGLYPWLDAESFAPPPPDYAAPVSPSPEEDSTNG